MSHENWLTRAQVTKALSVSAEYVQKLTIAGRINYVNTPLGRLYDPVSVEAAKAAGVGQIRKRTGHAF